VLKIAFSKGVTVMTQRSIGLGALAVLSATLLCAQQNLVPKAPEPYGQNERSPKPVANGLPAELSHGHKLYVAKCATCHTLSRSMKKSDLSAEEWSDIVDRMRNRPASHLNDAQAKAILAYLVWDGEQRQKKEDSK
jgi:mono/diheme cytochrome c family protein